MSIVTDSRCFVCMFQRNVETARSLGDEQTATEFARELMQLYLDGPKDVGTPWFTPGTNALFQKYYGLDPDRYRAEKQQSNQFILCRMDAIREKVTAAADPVYAALQFAILGNYIDFSALQDALSFEQLDEMLEKALEMELDPEVYSSLLRDLEQGKTLLYLTDNAGEIGFDRILAEVLQKKYSHLQITFCVRGGPALNDATREDAAAVGIDFPVIDNGSCIPGTELSELGQEAKNAMENTDVIFSKGMGNAETLMGCGKNVYYAFLIKCKRFVELFHKEMFTPMLLREK